MAQTTSSWRHNICQCGGCGTCMGAFFCAPCLYGRTSHRLEHYPDHPTNTGFSWVNAPCAIMCVAVHFGFGWLPIWLQRNEIRKKFDIKGDFCTDCLASCCCTCCAVAQNEVETRDRAESEHLNATVDQYSAQAGGEGATQYNQPGPMEYGVQKTF